MKENYTSFIDTVWQFYRENGRALPWRTDTSGYAIVVSEIMLQQTQVTRVVDKFDEFTGAFPGFKALADAPLSDVVEAWIGLGYNRRARFLHMTAQKVEQDFGGVLPRQIDQLQSLPGIGYNTAAAIRAYAFNAAHPFIETNIRSVYIHEFFADAHEVTDKDLLKVVTATLDTENPREWYWALMDYGSFLKKEFGNQARKSKHYAKQSKFEGSRRQVRGKILKQLIAGPMAKAELAGMIDDKRHDSVLSDLSREGFLTIDSGLVRLV